jgi:SHS2 domain-containing protein
MIMADRVMLPQDPEARSGGYELIDHTADIGIRVRGDTRRALFTHAGLALFDLIADRRRIRPTETRQVKITGIDPSDLLVNWLRELLYFWTGEARLVGSLVITSFAEREMWGTVSTAPYDPGCHEIRHDIKAVTYHRVEVRRMSAGWVAEVIFDV